LKSGVRCGRQVLKTTNFIDWYREHPLEDDLKLMKWNDEALGGHAYVDWYPLSIPSLAGWNWVVGTP